MAKKKQQTNTDTTSYRVAYGIVLTVAACAVALLVAGTIKLIDWML